VDIGWKQFALGTALAVFAAWSLTDAIRTSFPKPTKKAEVLGTSLGLHYRRSGWTGTGWWEGTWDRLPVRLVLLESETPSITVGPADLDKKGGRRWSAMDRRLEDDIVMVKGEPDPTPTGDKRFDEAFNVRFYEGANTAALTASMRELLLKAGPEEVTLKQDGLVYLMRDMPTAPKARLHLDTATGLARMAGIGRSSQPLATEAPT
jgi:hypothetical protein